MLTPQEAPRSERARVLLALREVHPAKRKPDQLYRRRDRRDLRDPADNVRADSRRHDSRRCADSARDHPARLPRVPGVRGATYDATPATSHDEFIRKVRTIAGTYQLLPANAGCSTRFAIRSGSRRCRTRRCGWLRRSCSCCSSQPISVSRTCCSTAACWPRRLCSTRQPSAAMRIVIRGIVFT